MFSELQKNYMTLSPVAARYCVAQSARAFDRYTERFDNALFLTAIKDQPTEYVNELVDDALAICGSPWYMPATRDSRNTDPAAQRFLQRFE